MNKLFVLIFCFISFVNTLVAQNANSNTNKLIKVTYVAIPTSQYQNNPNASATTINKDQLLANSYNYYYTLLINPNTQQSIYSIDSLVIKDKPDGMKDYVLMVNDSLSYVIKNNSSSFIKYESIFQREFYSVGNLNDIQWNLTSAEKTIYGLKSREAKPQNSNLLMNIWFTTEVPISSGPGVYLNLPGLVVRAEDFFWTTEIEKIEYIDSVNWEQKIASKEKEFEQNKKKNFIQEKQLLVEKTTLINSMIRMMNQ